MRGPNSSLALLLISLCMLGSGAAETKVSDYAVIVNPKNHVEGVTTQQLRKLLLGEDRFWNHSLPVSLVIRESGSAEGEFLFHKFLLMRQSEYMEHWNGKVFRGEASAEPIVVPSNGLATGLVASRVGCFALIRAENVPKNQTVKILKIDGKLPGDSGYPLR